MKLGHRPSKWIEKEWYVDSDDPLPSVAENALAKFFNFVLVDAISHLTRHLEVLNESVKILQTATFHQRQKVDELETQRQQNVHGKIEAHATLAAGKFLSTKALSGISLESSAASILSS